MFITSLKNPTPSQVNQLAELFSRAYDKHIPTLMSTKGDSRLTHDVFDLTVRAVALEGQLLVLKANERDDKILAASATFGPAVLFMISEEQRALGYDRVYETLPEDGKKWWEEKYHPACEKLLEGTIGKEAMLNARVPVLLATLPEYQRKGYGKALCKHICKLAAEAREVVSLMCMEDFHVALFKKQGFRVEGKSEKVDSPYGKFTCTVMSWGSGK